MKISTTQFILLLLVTAMVACTRILTSPVNPTAINTLAPSPSVQPTGNATPIFSPTAVVTNTVPPTLTVVVTTLEITSLPDLIIKFMYLEMEGRQSNCVEAYTPYEIRVLVENIGLTSAGPFVVDLNSMRQQVDDGLAAGQQIKLHFAGTTPSGRYEATADSIDQVVERDEDNNTLAFLAPTPTPPPLCTATPIPSP